MIQREGDQRCFDYEHEHRFAEHEHEHEHEHEIGAAINHQQSTINYVGRAFLPVPSQRRRPLHRATAD